MWKIVIVLGLFLSLSAVAYAGGSSEELYNKCHKLEKSPTDPKALISDVYCAAYVDGVVDGYRITADLYPKGRFICLPNSGLSNDVVIQIFSKWFKKNPKENNTPARSGVLLSLKDAYPCK